jgi:hypothetical protein
MTPEQIAALTALLNIVERLGAWPISSMFILIFFGPPILSLVNSYIQNRQIDKIEEFYRSNVVLVQNYGALCGDIKSIACELRDIVVLNTREWSSVKECIESNQYCPLVRHDRKIKQTITIEPEKE